MWGFVSVCTNGSFLGIFYDFFGAGFCCEYETPLSGIERLSPTFKPHYHSRIPVDVAYGIVPKKILSRE